MVKKILLYPDPALRAVMPHVDFGREDSRFLDHVEDLRDSLGAHGNGLAIASNQIERNGWHVFVVHPKVAEAVGTDVVINPTYVSGPQDGVSIEQEGCLSFPGMMFTVVRHLGITATYLDLNGSPITREFSGLIARMFQHEIDHLEGKLFIDKIQDKKLLRRIRVQMINQKKKR